MSREIKFRIWDSKSKNMEYDVFGIWTSYCLQDGSLMEIDGPGGGEFSVPTKNVLMQYTGLQDKNEKEIYEGDIIFLKNWNDHIPKRFNIPLDEARIVSFNEGSFILKELNGTANCYISYMNNEHAEVIGNIYKNSELLKDK